MFKNTKFNYFTLVLHKFIANFVDDLKCSEKKNCLNKTKVIKIWIYTFLQISNQKIKFIEQSSNCIKICEFSLQWVS